ncbi:MAG: hypothetical protein ACEQSA_04110, partial [Weeksellaceae bacterium]
WSGTCPSDVRERERSRRWSGNPHGTDWRTRRHLNQKKHHAVQNYQMYFDPTDGIIHIDKAKIELPLDSHQYHLAVCLFKNPTKPCTAEDVGKEFNEVDGNLWRRVYDAMLIVNKKVEPYTGEKLCVIRNKHFMINPRVIDNLRS